MTRKVDVKALVSHIIKGDGLDKCRICMGDTSEGQVYLEDTVMMDGDKPVTLAELLETITGVQLTIEPQCPICACVECVSDALAAQEFRVFVRNSSKIWTRAVNNIDQLQFEVVPNEVQSMYAVVQKDLTIDSSWNYYKTDLKTLVSKTNLKSHRNRRGVDKKPRCHRTGPNCKCSDCGRAFTSPFYLSQHLINSGIKDACLSCGEIVLRGKGMKEHMEIVHRDKVFLCRQCPCIFPTEPELKFHEKKTHRPGVFNCSDCGRSFPRQSSFESHLQMHTVNTCRVCGSQFTNRACYREHRSLCEPGAKPELQSLPRNRRSNIRDPAVYICDHCGKVYTSRPQLKNHIIWIHMNVRPHQCQWCGKRFYTPARLAEHSVVHTRVRRFECDICGAKLVTKMAAVYHRRRHTGERPYKCEDCGASFINASRRSEHAKRKHKKGVMFSCKECSCSFVRRHELQKHMNKAHPVVNWMAGGVKEETADNLVLGQ